MLASLVSPLARSTRSSSPPVLAPPHLGRAPHLPTSSSSFRPRPDPSRGRVPRARAMAGLGEEAVEDGGDEARLGDGARHPLRRGHHWQYRMGGMRQRRFSPFLFSRRRRIGWVESHGLQRHRHNVPRHHRPNSSTLPLPLPPCFPSTNAAVALSGSPVRVPDSDDARVQIALIVPSHNPI